MPEEWTGRMEELTGNLKDEGLPELLEKLHALKETGILTIKNGKLVRSIYIKDGKIVSASSSLTEERLGEMLVKAGMITQREYDISVNILKKTGKRQGAILVDAGFLAPKELFEGLKYQIKEIIFNIFMLDEGEYKYVPGYIPRQVIPLQIDTAELISEMIKRIKGG